MKNIQDILPPFYVIPIPINKQDRGPCSDADAIDVRYEIWDQLNQTIALYGDEEIANRVVILMNKLYNDRCKIGKCCCCLEDLDDNHIRVGVCKKCADIHSQLVTID